MKNRRIARRFVLSLLLIVVSFSLLLAIAYKSLVFQSDILSEQRQIEKVAQLGRISSDYFSNLSASEILPETVSLPLQQPVYPMLKTPESGRARDVFLRMSFGGGQKLPLLVEAELNAPESEQNFWRYLLMQELKAQSNYFALRQTAVQIIESKFDYLLANGRTLKTEAVLQIVDSFCREKNIEAAKQWLWRLGKMPAPTMVPENGREWLELPADLADWLDFLFNCYKISYSPEVRPGWLENALIVETSTGKIAFPARMVVKGLEEKFIAAGFNDIASLSIDLEGSNAYPLTNALGLKVAITRQVSAAPVPGGFLLLILLTSLAIIGLFGFALHQWQTMQRAQLLEEEELFFRQTAHDLKTPITIVSFIAETLALKRYKNEEQYNRYLNQLQNETQKAGELFDRLLLSVRLRQHSIDPDLKAFSPETALRALLNRFKPRMQDWQIIENYANQVSLHADYDMFERAMINLLENAIRHAAEGRELQIVCEDSILANQPAVLIKIGDRGKNFPLQAQGKIDLLSEALPYRAERGGSGTGLFLVKQIVQTHSGEFYAEKRTEGGIWMVTVWKGEK